MKELTMTTAAVMMGAFILSVLFGRIVLPILQKKKAGQYINEYAPESHQSKAGTPTMGGISFVAAFLVVMAAVVIYWASSHAERALIPLALVVLYAVGNTLIGLVDDAFKLSKRNNEGLTEMQKLVLQVVIAAGFIAMMALTGNLDTVLHIPFTKWAPDLGFFAYPLYLLVLVGFVNSTNITDGLDGLASSVCVPVATLTVALGLLGFIPEVAVSGAALVGCVLGFLVYNQHPAQMFMGDTGSLFLGAVIMGCAVMAGELALFVLAGFMFVIEMLTSLMQRLYFKLTHGKRLFLMAPLHHHLEKKGWGEVRIVVVFSLVSLAFCVLAFLGR